MLSPEEDFCKPEYCEAAVRWNRGRQPWRTSLFGEECAKAPERTMRQGRRLETSSASPLTRHDHFSLYARLLMILKGDSTVSCHDRASNLFCAGPQCHPPEHARPKSHPAHFESGICVDCFLDRLVLSHNSLRGR